jgi:L-ascorbate metabolism protein UlaG (beta-lactamase superfamily)
MESGRGGPERFFEAPLPLSELPNLDAVVLSHDHYDHMDEETLVTLKNKAKLFLTPLGVGLRMVKWGIPHEKIREFDWWEKTSVGDVELVFTPARHFSGRGLFDRNSTLWGGWAFVGKKQRLYFSGDTGYFPGFKEIGARLGPFDMTFIESGAYDNAWPDVHLGPEQAVKAHLDVRGKIMVPVHWGTFNLAKHAWTEPVERILVESEQKGVTLSIPRPGESLEPNEAPKKERWWPQLPTKTAKEDPIVSTHLSEE